MSNYQNLPTTLRNLLGVLEIAPSQLRSDTLAVCNYLEQPIYRIAVFAPFNHGKSTLLNALLGSKTLPIDLIPTTGAGIVVKYGTELATEIVLQNGEIIKEQGLEILSQYAVLDCDRRMRGDVAEVKVSCAHPWLKTGVELLDLPGTNDREAQNDLVRDKLLSADLIIHVLDARKLMTLEERQHLTQWLQNRGITKVVFVVNFLNLLTPDEQQEVRQRVYFIAESFRSDLPAGVSNIYCVDALPALRARLKGNLSAAQATGLTTLESALQTIASQRDRNLKLPRVIKIAESLLEQAIAKQRQLEKSSQNLQESKQIEVKQKAAGLIQQGFDRSVSDLRSWLYLPKLLTNYQPDLAIALQQTRFDRWLLEFEVEVKNQQQTVNKWIVRGCEFFAHSDPQLLAIDLASAPVIQTPESVPDRSTEDRTINAKSSNIPSELNQILQSKAGSVVLGGASYILNKVAPKSPTNSTPSPNKVSRIEISSQVYADAAASYLKEFSDRANAQLSEYPKLASKYLTFTPQTNTQLTATDYQLQLINSSIANLKTELNNL